jgi:ribosome-associated translation inhibitor RaiA
VTVKLTTPEHIVTRETYDWDLLIAIGNAFSGIEKQIKKDHSKKKSNR